MNWPFDNWLRLAVKRYGLSPNAFWEMPVREWLVLIKDIQNPSLDRARLDQLIQEFPDKKGGKHASR